MKYADYHKLSRKERKAFKKSGGKVEYNTTTKVVGFILTALIGFKLVSCAVAPDAPTAPAEPWQKADTACLNYVHQQVGGSVFDISTGSNKDVGDNTFKVRVNVKGKAGTLSVSCMATGDGEVKSIVGMRIK